MENNTHDHNVHDKDENKEQFKTVKFHAKGTTCESCAQVIRRQAIKVDGVKEAEFDYPSQTGRVEFDTTKTDIKSIFNKIEEKGYICSALTESEKTQQDTNRYSRTLGIAFAIIGIIVLAYFVSRFVDGIGLPQISQNMGYGLLFIVGLLTGFHCVSMCGGFVVSYTAKDAAEGKKSYKSHLLYGLGKVTSYTIIGAIFGLVGSIIAFTPLMRGIAGILAGIFLILFGLKNLNIIPALRKIQFRTPKFLMRFVGNKTRESSSPLLIGLLNGLMIACGPLQAVYVMAAGTGSAVEGAKLLFVFGLGTLPIMLGFGYLTTFVSSKLTHKILKLSGIIVIILGVLMLNNGLALTGTGYDFTSIIATVSDKGSTVTGTTTGTVAATTYKDGYQEIRMDVDSAGWHPDKFVLKTGVPVKWIINAKEITSCNKAIQVPKLELKFDLKPGEQTIEFTPTESGTIPWSCWMGMIPGTFIVKDDIDVTDTKAVDKALNSVSSVNTPAASSAGSCKMGGTGGAVGGGGGGGCGMM